MWESTSTSPLREVESILWNCTMYNLSIMLDFQTEVRNFHEFLSISSCNCSNRPCLLFWWYSSSKYKNYRTHTKGKLLFFKMRWSGSSKARSRTREIAVQNITGPTRRGSSYFSKWGGRLTKNYKPEFRICNAPLLWFAVRWINKS